MDRPLVDCYSWGNHTHARRHAEVCPLTPCWEGAQSTGGEERGCCGLLMVTPAVQNGVHYAHACVHVCVCVCVWWFGVKLKNMSTCSPSAIPITKLYQLVIDCVCFYVHFLFRPTHNSPLSTCVFVLYLLPSLHPTQPTKTTVCQPCFIIFCSLFQGKIFLFSFSRFPLWAAQRSFAQELIWCLLTEIFSLWIHIANDTF